MGALFDVVGEIVAVEAATEGSTRSLDRRFGGGERREDGGLRAGEAKLAGSGGRTSGGIVRRWRRERGGS